MGDFTFLTVVLFAEAVRYRWARTRLAIFAAILVNEQPLAVSLVGGGMPGAALDLSLDRAAKSLRQRTLSTG